MTFSAVALFVEELSAGRIFVAFFIRDGLIKGTLVGEKESSMAPLMRSVNAHVLL